MSEFRGIANKSLTEYYQREKVEEGGLGHTVDVLNKNNYNICFITAYTDYNNEEENVAANDSLEKDLRSLDYGFNKTIGGFQYEKGKISEEPGFQVIDRRLSSEDFLEEMIALGKRYDQWSVLIKPKDSKVRCIITKPNNENFGKDDPEFDPEELKHANPKQPLDKNGNVNFKGYTQLQRDLSKNPARAIQYTNKYDKKHIDLVDSITEDQLKNIPLRMYTHGRRPNNSGNLSICCARESLGLNPYYRIK